MSPQIGLNANPGLSCSLAGEALRLPTVALQTRAAEPVRHRFLDRSDCVGPPVRSVPHGTFSSPQCRLWPLCLPGCCRTVAREDDDGASGRRYRQQPHRLPQRIVWAVRDEGARRRRPQRHDRTAGLEAAGSVRAGRSARARIDLPPQIGFPRRSVTCHSRGYRCRGHWWPR